MLLVAPLPNASPLLDMDPGLIGLVRELVEAIFEGSAAHSG